MIDYDTITHDELSRTQILECLRANTEHCWRRVLGLFRRVVAGTVIKGMRKFGPADPAEVEDLIQDTFLKLCLDSCRVLRQANAVTAEAVFGLVQAVAITTVLDHHRAAMALKRGGNAAWAPLDGPGGNDSDGAAAQSRLERSILIEEIDLQLRQLGDSSVNDRDRRIFWLHYRNGLTAKDISRLADIDLGVKGVESALSRVTQAVRKCLGGPVVRPEGKTH